MKNTSTKNNFAPAPSRLIKIILFTIVGVIAAVALVSVLANYHGGIPFEQQTHLRMFGIAKPASRYDTDVTSYAVYEAAIKAAARLDESDFLMVVLGSEYEAYPSDETVIIRDTIELNGTPPQKRAVITRGKRNVTSSLLGGSGLRWHESVQWCIKVKPDKGNEQRFGNLLWDLSSVTGASVIGLQPQERRKRKRGDEPSELPKDLALKIAGQYPEGFLLPLESTRSGATKDELGGADWKISLQSKTCPTTNTPLAITGLEETRAMHDYGVERAALAARVKEKEDELENARREELCAQKRAEKILLKELSPGDLWACDLRSNEVIAAERLKSRFNRRAKYVQAAVAASTDIKLAATRHFANKVKWPANNLEAGLRAPETYSTALNESGVAIVSISVERYASRSLVHVKYWNENRIMESLFFHALTDSSDPKAWDCVSRTMKDIADFVPTCKYLAK